MDKYRETRAHLTSTSNIPTGVKIDLRDWGMGGVRQVVTLSLWEAIQLRAELDRVLDP